tara:strand:+ start:119 stop:418 length:300 start_codon:yes stop_codon:yes gene_type:complete
MSIKIALLKSGEQVVTDIKELMSEDKPVGYLFKDPETLTINKSFLVSDSDTSVEISLTQWILMSSDRELAVPTDWIVTIAEPIDSVMKMYKDKIDAKNN